MLQHLLIVTFRSFEKIKVYLFVPLWKSTLAVAVSVLVIFSVLSFFKYDIWTKNYSLLVQHVQFRQLEVQICLFLVKAMNCHRSKAHSSGVKIIWHITGYKQQRRQLGNSGFPPGGSGIDLTGKKIYNYNKSSKDPQKFQM